MHHFQLCGRLLAGRSVVPPPPALRRGCASASAPLLLLIRPVVVFRFAVLLCLSPIQMKRDMVAVIVLSHAISSSVRVWKFLPEHGIPLCLVVLGAQ
jgi:hypothetical protein